MAATVAAHDHIVLLLGKEAFEDLPAWLTENFKIIEGGTHATGSSRNKLIVFKDGTYLELFNWISEPREFLDWAQKSSGLIDFAMTTMPPVRAEENYSTVRGNLSKIPPESDLGISFGEPKFGGRKRADGTEVKWQTTRPVYSTTTSTPKQKYFADKRMDVPFFCHDITERTVRVPFDDESITTHPCGAIGIDHVQVLVPESHIDAYLDAYGAFLNVEKPSWFMDEHHDEGALFKVNTPSPTDERPAFVAIYPTRHYKVEYSSADPRDPPNPEAEDQAFLEERGIGIRSITLRRAEDAVHGHDIASLGSDAIGRTVKLKGWLHRPNAGTE